MFPLEADSEPELTVHKVYWRSSQNRNLGGGQGKERCKIRQKEKLNCDTASTKAPGDSIRNSEIGMTLLKCIQVSGFCFHIKKWVNTCNLGNVALGKAALLRVNANS